MVVSINIDETVLRPNVRPAKPKSKRGTITFFVDIEAPNGRSVRRSLVRGVDDLNDDYEQPPAAISLGTLLLSLNLSSTFYWDTPVAFDSITADFFLQQFEVGVGGNIDVPDLELSVDMETTAEASISRAPIIVDLTLPQFNTNKTITFEPIDIGLSLPTLETKVGTSLDIITVDLTVPALNTDIATNFEALGLSMSLPDAEIASDIYGELAVVNLSVAGTLDTGININLPASMESAQDDDVATIGSPSLLLDTYSGAAAAYSLRKLSTSYSGSAIRIREDGGGSQTDIGFDSNGDLDTNAIAAWCGPNNGFVVTWYDQSGNGNDISQTAVGNQPEIYDGSNVYRSNGKPSVAFDQSTLPYLFTSVFTTSTTASVAIVCQHAVDATTRGIYENGSSNGHSLSVIATTDYYNWSYQGVANYSASAGSAVANTQTLLFGRTISGSSHDLWKNGSSILSTTPGTMVTPSGSFWIGAVNSVTPINGRVQEFVLWDNDQSANRTSIESDINTYFSVYP